LILTSTTEKDLILISTRIRDTLFKKKLASLDLGTLVNITAPMGKFVLPDDHSSKSVVFLSGGIGVTPFRSMVKYATDKQLSLKITVFDSNRDQDNILYKKEFDECVIENKNLKIIYTIADERQESI
ncbi:MAG: FAD-dependent oxidoreductase, partial [Candidatus Nitrosopolaris sp.]